jgi:hypothetical protein
MESPLVRFTEDRPLADPESAIKKLIEIANTAEAMQDGRIHIELINMPFLRAGGTPSKYRAAVKAAIDRGWLTMHHSGAYVTFTKEGADLFT